MLRSFVSHLLHQSTVAYTPAISLPSLLPSTPEPRRRSGPTPLHPYSAAGRWPREGTWRYRGHPPCKGRGLRLPCYLVSSRTAVCPRRCRPPRKLHALYTCLLYTSPSPRDRTRSRMPSSA